MVKKRAKKTTSSYAKLNAYKFGLAGGILGAICIAFTTIVGIYGWLGGLSLWNSIIADIYSGIGYEISWLGALLGGIYGFVDCFIATWLFALIYNKLNK